MAQIDEDNPLKTLYHNVLAAWNKRSPKEYANLFLRSGDLVGHDGNLYRGQAAIQAGLEEIFGLHPTPAYIGKIRSIRLVSDECAVLLAVCGMVPAGGNDINPALNAVQTMVAIKTHIAWRVVSFQNTPAVFHNHPELSELLTYELRNLLREAPPSMKLVE